ncbi:hypothetical protein IMC75_03000 [Campylobacter peloridis]|uniref:Uncharacterized protein n=1 Tax=Campylobacter peloridis TaxID=488546 RepID=A0ABX6TV85_9BACT|nr:hypothetical protein [Campylobacter peloridis]AJC85438.1 hypothetical protein CPEL_1640 [Campylobacter peloridis LMG 23910]QOQ89444.1 hypothetical protein IMC75_03000 [Campylobacter peloridis]
MKKYCFIKFIIDNEESFKRLCDLFNYIKILKNENLQLEDLYADKNIHNFYSEKELEYFLHADCWEFDDIFDCIGCGEYYFHSIEKIEKNIAKLYFYPTSFPYGGVEPIIEFIKSFQMKILSVDCGYMEEFEY